MDFKEDQLAIEAHVRMRCGWRDMDEISEEEYLEYAIEYMQENPIRYPGVWVETFVDNANKTYAGLGYTYNAETENFTAPIDPTPEA